ncbi:probable zinc metalloprotease egy2 chloroplastic [Phtheirospermum japonicum]|uniref:Probable zinc metalloprotease egy2 chloroplastic n=1 Tax=Phtheirospermum japonicum TaxID=374723 RepID=A0A830BE01_9LAMI|nr:probable zinc metalloprotease egy2 chloroplastic [Phtheirospermum japonicum]
MNLSASFGGNLVIPLSRCDSCSRIRFSSPATAGWKFSSRYLLRGNLKVVCRSSETEPEPESNNEEERKLNGEKEGFASTSDSSLGINSDQDSQNVVNNQSAESDSLETKSLFHDDTGETNDAQDKFEDVKDVQVTSGSPLPGVKQEFDESIRIPKETIDVLKDQVFGFDTFFVTSQEPYEGGVLFKGNLRGQASKSYEKIARRMKDKFGDLYKLFLLTNPEDDKPVAVVVPKKILQPDTTAVPEWFAAGAFGLVTVFTLLLRNVPALQTNLLSVFDNVDLLKDGLPGALVTALILGVHEISHFLVAKEAGIKLGVPYFVPSWQIGSFGSITRIRNIVPKREDLLKVAAAGPTAGFALGSILLLLGFVLPPADELGLVVDPSVFHESFLVGGLAKLLLGDILKEGTPLSINPLVIWAWAGLLINAINSIPAGELDGGRISFAIWGRKASSRFTAASIALLGLSSLFNDVAFYWVALIFFLQRGPIAPLSEEITDPDDKYKALGVLVLLFGLLNPLRRPRPGEGESGQWSKAIEKDLSLYQEPLHRGLKCGYFVSIEQKRVAVQE